MRSALSVRWMDNSPINEALVYEGKILVAILRDGVNPAWSYMAKDGPLARPLPLIRAPIKGSGEGASRVALNVLREAGVGFADSFAHIVNGRNARKCVLAVVNALP